MEAGRGEVLGDVPPTPTTTSSPAPDVQDLFILGHHLTNVFAAALIAGVGDDALDPALHVQRCSTWGRMSTPHL